MFTSLETEVTAFLEDLKDQGLYKRERVITTPQGATIGVLRSHQQNRSDEGAIPVLNLCANNYLGFSSDPDVIEAAAQSMREWGYGLSSVRFICGTQQIHLQLERAVSEFLGTDDTILYAACFDANGGVFEPLLNDQDVIISDELNHASLIDGIRLCKAARLRYRHADMASLEEALERSVHDGHRRKLICTDGVFSMDGDIAPLRAICDLARTYDALVLVDDSHATGYIGASGRGTIEHCGVQGEVDLITTTFGKALGGASGGCVSGRGPLIELLRQRSRPYLFSNTLAPAVVGGTLRVLGLLSASTERRDRLMAHAVYFRRGLEALGFDILPGDTAIVPVMLYDERTALAMADRLLGLGVYVIGFAYPVVPLGKARIRTQLSAAHTREDLDRALEAFGLVGREMGIIS